MERCKRHHYLKENGLHIKEDQSSEERAARKKAWPLVKHAREEGRRPAFVEDLPSLKGYASVFLTLPERMVAVSGYGYRGQRKCFV